MPETSTSAAEVTHVYAHALWLMRGEEELMLPFEKFPWFKHATIDQLSQVEWLTPNHLYWPQFDVGLSVESIEPRSSFRSSQRLASNPSIERTFRSALRAPRPAAPVKR